MASALADNQQGFQRQHSITTTAIEIQSQALGGDQEALQNLIRSCNANGSLAMRQGKMEEANDQFKYAEAMLLGGREGCDNRALLAVTCSNMGCYYKQVGKFHGALNYLRKALRMEVELGSGAVTLAGTHLNICALLSKLNKHDQALQHALGALKMMSHEFQEQDDGDRGDDECCVLAMCYYNVATERSFLKQFDQAATFFQTGVQIANRLLGKDHPLSVALETNCDAAMRDAKEALKAKHKPVRQSQRQAPTEEEDSEHESEFRLPPINIELAKEEAAKRSGPAATDWIKEEAGAWSSFAKTIMRDAPSSRHPSLPPSPQKSQNPGGILPPLAPVQGEQPAAEASPKEQTLERTLAPATDFEEFDDFAEFELGTNMFKAKPKLATKALAEYKQRTWVMPSSHDMGLYRFQDKIEVGKIIKKLPIVQALDDNPAALLDILDADTGPSKNAGGDNRPHRSMPRQSRTARLLRRTGVHNTTQARDKLALDLKEREKKTIGKDTSQAAQQGAAVRIQSAWRRWCQYCQMNSEWMTVTWICATMIQSHWRSYHVRRIKMDRAANTIGRRIRGCLVRKILWKHKACTKIQKLAVGMSTRGKLRRMRKACIDIQRLTRGHLTRKWFVEFKAFKLSKIITIQKLVRVHMAHSCMKKKREDQSFHSTRHKAAVDLQRLFRGRKGRQRVDLLVGQRDVEDTLHLSALKLQQLIRMRRARKRVNELRAVKGGDFHEAAAFVQKLWRGKRTQKQYNKLKGEMKMSEAQVITIQRYMRGNMCRLKMWREAVRAEEESYGAIGIQKLWRGYMGRVRFEMAYEQIWRRELAAAKVQPAIRSWLAYLRVSRMKRTIARKEFEHAQKRYRAARAIQAIVRGRRAKKRVRAELNRKHKAAAQIQRIARGGQLRTRLWKQIVNQKVTVAQSLVRRFIVRNRRHNLVKAVILIQRLYRHWRTLPKITRMVRRAGMVDRRDKAVALQQKFRSYIAANRIHRIKAMSSHGSPSATGTGK